MHTVIRNTIPQLTQLLKEDDSSVRVAAANLIARLVGRGGFLDILQLSITYPHFKLNCMPRLGTAYKVHLVYSSPIGAKL
jgi:hypothetical protein